MAPIAIDKEHVAAVLVEVREFHQQHGHDIADIWIGTDPFCEHVRAADARGAYDWYAGMDRLICLGNPSATLLGIASMAQATLFGV